MGHLNARLNRIEGKVNPSRYAQLEDIIHMQDLESQEQRTHEEDEKLNDIKGLPVDPQLAKALMRAEERKTNKFTF